MPSRELFAEALEALSPFVEWHRVRETQGGLTGAAHHADSTPIFMAASVEGEQLVTLGDLRRARAAADKIRAAMTQEPQP